MSRRPAVFLDRDGTVITERGYLSDPRRIRFYPFAFDALRRLARAGYALVVVSNQSGVARGFFSLERLREIDRAFVAALRRNGVRLAGTYYCPHGPESSCACRKPRPGLARRAARELGLDLRRSYVVGDQPRDLEMGRAVGATPVLVLTGGGRRARRTVAPDTKVTSTLATAARWIERAGRARSPRAA